MKTSPFCFSFLSFTDIRMWFGVMECVHCVSKRLYWCTGMSPEQGESSCLSKNNETQKTEWIKTNVRVCVFVSVRENFYFFILGYDLAIDQVVPSLSFDWQQSQHLLKLLFFFIPHVPFLLFFKLHFSLFLSRDPSQQHAAPKCNLWFVWQCMSKSKRRGRKYPDWCETL